MTLKVAILERIIVCFLLIPRVHLTMLWLETCSISAAKITVKEDGRSEGQLTIDEPGAAKITMHKGTVSEDTSSEKYATKVAQKESQ